MAQPPEMSQGLIKIFVENGLDEIRRIEDQALSELVLRSKHEKRATPKQEQSTPRGYTKQTGSESEGKDENGISSQ